MMDHFGIGNSVKQFGIGVAGLVLITFAAVRLGLQPGAVSLLYLIAVVFVSLRAGLVSSIAVSLVAVFLLQYYFVPLFSPPASKNPLAIVASLAFLCLTRSTGRKTPSPRGPHRVFVKEI